MKVLAEFEVLLVDSGGRGVEGEVLKTFRLSLGFCIQRLQETS